MELEFEYSRQVGTGTNPAVVHFPDNSIMLFWIHEGRLLSGSKIKPPTGDVDWGSLDFGAGEIVTGDKEVSYMRLKNIPRLGIYGVWHSMDPRERHRFAIYEDQSTVTNYLEEGSIELRLDTPVVPMRLTLNNPKQILSGEDKSRIVPGMQIELFFQAGDSEEYPMGVYFTDRVDMQVTEPTISVETRNISGKLLKDQTFDQNYHYPKQVYAETVKAVLDNAGVKNYLVQTGGTWDLGMSFPANMTFIDGLQELIKASRNWTMRENLEGQIILGSTLTYEPLQQINSRYTFNRGTDVWGRGIVRDDNDVYSRVCVHQLEMMLTSYVEVPNTSDWNYVPQKTLYVEVPNGTPEMEMWDLATEIADRLKLAGTIETCIGPFRPQLLPGDEAEIISESGTKLLGLITTVRHVFGKQGYATEFVVDSAGRIGKPQIKEYINRVTANKGVSGAVKRLE